jgi:hypothetical protein
MMLASPLREHYPVLALEVAERNRVTPERVTPPWAAALAERRIPPYIIGRAS